LDLTNITEAHITLVLGVIGLLSGLTAYVLNFRIKTEILEHNEKTLTEIKHVRETNDSKISELQKEVGKDLDQIKGKLNSINIELEGVKSTLHDKILTTVNGKYVRSDLHSQSMDQVTERLNAFKQLIEMHLAKIEQGFDRQIDDLKERIKDQREG